MTENLHLSASHLLWSVIDWIYPPVCCGCGQDGHDICPECQTSLQRPGADICQKCGKTLDPLDGCLTCGAVLASYDAARAAFFYEGTIREAIHQLKFNGNLGISRLLSKMLFSVYLMQKWQPDLVTAVPLTKRHLNERGFNQSNWLAAPIARLVGLKFLKGALQKTLDTETQVGLDHTQRFENLKGAFQAEPVLVKGKSILLIDDVMTTGATFNECAKTLKQAGAKKVYCLSVATTRPI